MLGFVSAIIFLLPIYLIRFTFFGVPTTALELLIYLAAMWLIVSQPIFVTIRRSTALLRRYGWPLGLILLGSCIGLFIAPDLRSALGLLKAYILDPILLFGVISVSQNLPEQPWKIDIYKAAFIALGVSLALSALFIPSAYTPDGRALGVYVLDATSSPNFLALLLAPLAAFSFALVLFDKNKTTQLWGILGFLVMIAGLWTTGSRGALLAIAVACVAMMTLYSYERVVERFKRNLRLVGALLILLLVLAVGWVARPNFGNQASARATTSNNIRYEIWRTTVVDMIPRYGLLGVGLGGYQQRFTELTAHRVNFPEFISPWAVTPHNVFLTWWMNVGLLGLIGFAWIIWLYYQNIRHTPKSMGSFALALGFAMLALLLHGLVDAAYWKNDLAALFWILIGLSQVCQKNEEEDVTA